MDRARALQAYGLRASIAGLQQTPRWCSTTPHTSDEHLQLVPTCIPNIPKQTRGSAPNPGFMPLGGGGRCAPVRSAACAFHMSDKNRTIFLPTPDLGSPQHHGRLSCMLTVRRTVPELISTSSSSLTMPCMPAIVVRLCGECSRPNVVRAPSCFTLWMLDLILISSSLLPLARF